MKKENIETIDAFILRKKAEVENRKRIYKRKKKVEVGNIIIVPGIKGKFGTKVWKAEAITLLKQSNSNDIVFIERKKLLDIRGKTSQPITVGCQYYRIGYFIVRKIGNLNPQWTVSPFSSLLIPIDDFNKLIKLAKKEKTIVNGKDNMVSFQ